MRRSKLGEAEMEVVAWVESENRSRVTLIEATWSTWMDVVAD